VNDRLRVNLKRLRPFLLNEISWFGRFGELVKISPNEFYFYRDNGAKVLGIAHLDTVHSAKHCYEMDFAGERTIFASGMDDRLGAYILLDWLPRLGVQVDWLLTTNEEMGQSTAELFEAHKDYNWIFSFDRAGTDVVMYQYEHKDYTELLKRYGFRVGFGSYSCIADLSFLGVTGFNFGTGYYDNHSVRAYMICEDTEAQVARFLRFYADQRDVYLPAKINTTYKRYRWNTYTDYSGRFLDWDDRGEEDYDSWWDRKQKEEKDWEDGVFAEDEDGWTANCAGCGILIDPYYTREDEYGVVHKYREIDDDYWCEDCLYQLGMHKLLEEEEDYGQM
jgi:hypothetical protein